jgi:hypothetical protein
LFLFNKYILYPKQQKATSAFLQLWLNFVAKIQHLWSLDRKRPVRVIKLIFKLMLALSFHADRSTLLSGAWPATSASAALVAALCTAIVGAV